MTRLIRSTGALVSVVLLAQTPSSPSPTPEPVFELRRTAEGAHVHPMDVNPLVVLVIGSDIREGDPARGRADSLHVVAVNTKNGKGTIVGIPRDSYVHVPGLGNRKVNAALSLRGPQTMVETVRQLSGLPIHYWALTEFSRFRRLVDRLGGLEVAIPYRMADRASGAFFQPGRKHLNGAQVLAFARARKTISGGDFERSRNHGRVLKAALAKFRAEATSPFEMLEYFRAFQDLVVSDVPTRDLIELGLLARRLHPDGIQNVVLPAAGGASAGGQSVVLLGEGARDIFRRIADDGVL